MHHFSQRPRKLYETPGCSLLYGHPGLHLIARKRRAPDVLDPGASSAHSEEIAARRLASGRKQAAEAPFVLPAGCCVAAPPPAEQLAFGSPRGDVLLGRRLLYRWEGAGWCLGQVARRNTSAAETVGREPVRFSCIYCDEPVSSLALHLKASSNVRLGLPLSLSPSLKP